MSIEKVLPTMKPFKLCVIGVPESCAMQTQRANDQCSSFYLQNKSSFTKDFRGQEEEHRRKVQIRCESEKNESTLKNQVTSDEMMAVKMNEYVVMRGT